MLLLIFSILLQTGVESSWQIRSGHMPYAPAADHLRELVASGYMERALALWRHPDDRPATRRELLSVLSWNYRYEILPAASAAGTVPSDMEGSVLADNCALICQLGWMVPGTDGLFHPDDPVSRGDLVRLSGFLPGIPDTLDLLPLSILEEIHL